MDFKMRIRHNRRCRLYELLFGMQQHQKMFNVVFHEEKDRIEHVFTLEESSLEFCQAVICFPFMFGGLRTNK